jgi:DinB family protein
MERISPLLLAISIGLGPMQGPTFKPSSNPVTDSVRDLAARHAKHLIASAELMPADKYGYRPTDAQMTFGDLIAHIVHTNVALCSAIGGAPPPIAPAELKKVAGTVPKDALVAAIKQSFDYCTDAVTKVTDPQLGEQARIFGQPVGLSRAAALITMAVDWADHYSTAASYLRLNGILPPSAQPKQ